ncbi:MAG: hypothetical protein H7Z71_08640 [Moraxellaceae bacterium]|nr:hypothetical protein [Pseudobdellovibrionaceae bacterium]
MHYITAYYKFIPIEDVNQAKEFFNEISQKTNTRGLVILAEEGFNSTVSNKSLENLYQYKQAVLNYFKLETLSFKDSRAEKAPFRDFVLKVRPEIVTSGKTDLRPLNSANNHLSPAAWDQMMARENPVLIDTRNWYEYRIGTFKGALNPNTEKFSEFSSYMESQNITRDQKIMIFCTGGIRCEKGILELQEKGFSQIYQLEGGILNYLNEKPRENFEGECFVFDQRVAVDQNLKPTQQYTLCPHCGQPGKTKIDCHRCDTPMQICEDCIKLEWKKDTCSKNCAHLFKLHPGRKSARQAPRSTGDEDEIV